MANNVPSFESVLRQFEIAWRSGHPPRIADFWHAPADNSLLIELALVDMEYRIRAGGTRCVEAYAHEFPTLAVPEVLLDLIVCEYQLRTRHHQSPPLQEYHTRFPQLQQQLEALAVAQQWDAHAHTIREARPGTAIWQFPVIPDIILGQELGRGGMGIVYRGDEPTLGRAVAVKTLLHYPDTTAAARFRREAETIARLDHPHIVKIHRVGTWDARGIAIPYFVMPYYTGGPLTRPAGDVRQHVLWLLQVALAVQHAHERGVLHRDLKPSNILLDDQQQAYVTDFGLAGWFDLERTPEFTNVVVGTPAYMAPEQARDPARVTTAVDVYGLGGILYFQLTGQPPFCADTPLATLKLVEEHPPTPPSHLQAAIPRDLEIICLKCLAKNPHDRYASPAALIADLRAWLDGRPITARPATVLERTWRLARRHPFVSLLASATVGALVFAVVVLLVANTRIRREENDAKQARDHLQVIVREQQRSLYIERVATAGRLAQANSLTHAWHLLDLCPAEERFWEWHYLDRLRQAPGVVLRPHASPVRSVALLADGSPVTVDNEGVVRWWTTRGELRQEWRVPAGNTLQVLPHPQAPTFVVATVQGAYVFADRHAVPQRTLSGDGPGVLHPDGSRVFIAVKNALQGYDLENGRPVGSAIPLESAPLCGRFTQDGKRLYIGTASGSVVVWDMLKNERAGPIWRRPRPVIGLELTRDETTLLESMPSTVRLTEVATGRRLHLNNDVLGRPVLLPGPTPTSYFMTTTTYTLQLHDVDATRTPRWQLTGHSGYIAAATTRGTIVLTGSADGTARLYDTSQPSDGRVFGAFGNVPFHMHLDATGQQLVLIPATPAQKEPQAVVFATSTGTETLRVPGWGDAVFGPQGTLLVSDRLNLTQWDLPTNTMRTTHTLTQPISRLAYDANRSEVVVGDLRGGVQFLNLATGQPTSEPLNLGSTIYALEPQGDRLLVAARDAVEVHDRRTQTRLLRYTPTNLVRDAALAPDGQHVAVASGNQTFVLVALDNEVRQPFIGVPGDLHNLAFHPSGRRLATAGTDGRVRVWDVESGRELLTLDSGSREAFAVAWSPDGHELYAVGTSIRVWRGD